MADTDPSSPVSPALPNPSSTKRPLAWESPEDESDVAHKLFIKSVPVNVGRKALEEVCSSPFFISVTRESNNPSPNSPRNSRKSYQHPLSASPSQTPTPAKNSSDWAGSLSPPAPPSLLCYQPSPGSK